MADIAVPSQRFKLFHHHHRQVSLTVQISRNLSLHLSLSSIASGRISDSTLSSHRADISNFLLVHQHLWVHLCLSSSIQQVLFVLLGWFLWWEVSGCTVAILRVVASRICSKCLVSVYMVSKCLVSVYICGHICLYDHIHCSEEIPFYFIG